MSETTNPTAGEREAACPWCHYGDPHPTFADCPSEPGAGDECRCPPDHAMGFTVHERPCRFAPAEPGAGEVEALARELAEERAMPFGVPEQLAHTVITSDWLAAMLDRERREVGAKAWDQGHLDGCEDTGRMTARLHRELCLRRNPYRADRIEANP